MNRKPVVTIDGPAGAGKSTIGRMIAERLSFIYLDTGALYRAVALGLREQGWDGREDSLITLCRNLRVEMRQAGDRLRVFVDGDDVTGRIRSEEIGLQASRVSALPAVREMLLAVQRGAAAGGGVVAEGRDMGSVVFPDAEFKFFLDAAAGERANRRYLELTARGDEVDRRNIKADLLLRDRQDRGRTIAPLVIPPDAIVIDSTDKTISQVVDIMLGEIEKAGKLPGLNNK